MGTTARARSRALPEAERQTRRSGPARAGAPRLVLATLALGVWAAHVLTMVVVHDAPLVEGLWMCHVAPLVLGLGCALGSARVASVGTSWLALGLPLWLGNLVAFGERVEPTPALVHVGTFAVGVAAARAIGWDRGAWWRAAIALATLAALTRLFPSAERENINLVFRVWPGFDRFFTSHAAFLAFVIVATPLAFYAIGLALAPLARRGDTKKRRARARRPSLFGRFR